jgi:hypothetical protein
LGQDTLLGQTLSGEPINLRIADILLLETKRDSKVVEGFLLGALAGGLLFGAAALQVQADETREIDAGKAIPVGIVLVLAGGGIGAAIGASSSTWEEVPLGDMTSRSGTDLYLAARVSF